MLGLMLTLGGATVGAVPTPYFENFDGYANGAAPSGFVTTTAGLNATGVWGVAHDGMNGRYGSTLSGNQGSTSAAIEITNLGGSGFVFSSTFVLGTPFTTSGFYDCQISISAFAGSAALHKDISGYRVTYETFSMNAPFVTPGSLSLAGVETQLPGSGSTVPVVAGTTYTISLSGVYTASGLMLTATLTDGINTVTRSGFDSTPASGTFFGYTNRASASTIRSISSPVQFDNLAIVPEPSTVACLLVGAFIGATAVHRRGRSR